MLELLKDYYHQFGENFPIDLFLKLNPYELDASEYDFRMAVHECLASNVTYAELMGAVPNEEEGTEPTEDEPTEDEPTEDEPTKDEPTKDEPTKDEPIKDEPIKDEDSAKSEDDGTTENKEKPKRGRPSAKK